MTYVINEKCVDEMDRSCVAECPVDCIYEGSRSLYIHPDECIDCGACEATCPVRAIAYQDDLPGPEAERIVTRSREWLTLHAAGGGAKRVGPIGTDHPDIAALPAGSDQA